MPGIFKNAISDIRKSRTVTESCSDAQKVTDTEEVDGPCKAFREELQDPLRAAYEEIMQKFAEDALLFLQHRRAEVLRYNVTEEDQDETPDEKFMEELEERVRYWISVQTFSVPPKEKS